MIVNVFDERAPGKHQAAPLERGQNVVIVEIKKTMTMREVVSKIVEEIKARGGGPESVSIMRFFGHGNAGMMEFGRDLQYWNVEPFRELATYLDPNGKGLELHGCYTASAVSVPGQDCSKPGAFYPRESQPGYVGLGFELLLALSTVLNAPVTGGINCQYEDPAHKLEGPTISVSPSGTTMRNVPIDRYDDRGQSAQKKLQPTLSDRIKVLPETEDRGHSPQVPESDLSERIRILPDSDDPFHRFGADTLAEVPAQEFDPLDSFDECGKNRMIDPFQIDDSPITPSALNPLSIYGADRLRDVPTHDPLHSPNPFNNSRHDRMFDPVHTDDRPTTPSVLNPFFRYGADKLTDVPVHDPFHSSNPDPFGRVGQDRVIDLLHDDSSDHNRSFNPFSIYGADTLRDVPTHDLLHSPNPFNNSGHDRMFDPVHTDDRLITPSALNPFFRYGANQLTHTPQNTPLEPTKKRRLK
ncbi:MAG: hypothetical protein HXS42_05420 [Theionarchaea archaeon]|nr:hypothetical protein [Theionarchaea archaeon]MBU7039303.1 hypothetical protein [Theionarchaea archaeon]